MIQKRPMIQKRCGDESVCGVVAQPYDHSATKVPWLQPALPVHLKVYSGRTAFGIDSVSRIGGLLLDAPSAIFRTDPVSLLMTLQGGRIVHSMGGWAKVKC